MTDTTVLDTLSDTECKCEKCQSYCDRPGWLSPLEAERAIADGYGDRLMLDYWAGDDDAILILGAAIIKYEGKPAPYWPKGQCTFYRGGLCELHATPHKPLECRLAHHDGRDGLGTSVHKAIAHLWNTPIGKRVVALWQAQWGADDE